jgi:hypothetical protein
LPKKKTEISKEERDAWQKRAMQRNMPTVWENDSWTKGEIERARGQTQQP